jgi:hypothetical protein
MKLKLNKKIILASFLSLFIFLIFTTTSHAAVTNPVIGDLGTSEGTEDGSKFINYTVYLWKVSINLGALAVIVFFLWGAFEWITAGSDSKKTETARSRMTNAIIGLVILVSSFTILSFVSKVFFGKNFDLLKLTLPTQLDDSSVNVAPSSAAGRGTNYNNGTLVIPATVTPAGSNR